MVINRILGVAARLHAQRVLARFLRAANNATRTQSTVLAETIARNAGSTFGRDFGFAHIRSYEDFVRQVPILRYDDLSSYVERVKAGDTQAMFGGGQRVLMFAMSSGTTDAPKYVPVTERFLKEYRRGWNAFGVKALTDHPEAVLRPIVQVTSRMDEERTSAGIPCGAITGILAATQKRIVRKYYVTPMCVAYVADAAARYYTIVRLALAGDVAFMITANPATQLKLARTLETHTEALIRDVRDGTLDASLNVPGSVRAELAPRLRADPRRAAELAAIAERSGRLLPKHCWNLSFLANWTGGTMGLYLQEFPKYFGDVPVRDIGLLASEGRMSVPLADGTPGGVLDVAANFYEFIPATERESSTPTVLRSHELEVGQDYFILLTTSAGFYRYDISDLVRVCDFHGEAPIIEFLNKGAHVSSLTGEKVSEKQAVLAFERASRSIGLSCASFVLAPQWAGPPFYRLHVEAGGGCDPTALAALEREMEAQLAAVNTEYASKRSSRRLGPVQVNTVPAGFLADLDARSASRHRQANEQYKHRYLYPAPGEDADFPTGAPKPPATSSTHPAHPADSFKRV